MWAVDQRPRRYHLRRYQLQNWGGGMQYQSLRAFFPGAKRDDTVAHCWFLFRWGEATVKVWLKASRNTSSLWSRGAFSVGSCVVGASESQEESYKKVSDLQTNKRHQKSGIHIGRSSCFHTLPKKWWHRSKKSNCAPENLGGTWLHLVAYVWHSNLWLARGYESKKK